MTGISQSNVMFANMIALIAVIGTYFTPSPGMYSFAGVMCIVAGIVNFAMAWDCYQIWKSKK